MTDATVLTVGREALWTGLLVAAPVLGLTVLVGVAISILQAATQVTEQTLVFVPKILAAAAALLLFGPWMLTTLVRYTVQLYQSIPGVLG
ncbi:MULTISPECIES: flagellar biosynthesis protein FliQ [Thermaerobacter]|uniref:Flagellar biosynthetic protein FliQ n=1 Tax=Thermaerobacter composti TaxID=554949 RepID=A0ABZ0QR47_9FIRM|nr:MULTISPECIES: flagellar biosynthesis protein FliQ [Thermaerobacter]PZN04429.1 MAG: flagellar biosynthetic protein FliQ [Bacillota bacterium]QBS37822.1 flagellar biosynthesis protein FliQ [Thermaerobacter sp. FW80]WPD19980.1 flagellar biosynthesis protein FliQ [Thermaerobacter composti]